MSTFEPCTEFMQLALGLAKEAFDDGEVPVGAVVVKDGAVVGTGRNRREKDRSALAHAELEAIQMACRTLGGWRLWQCELYVTLEPCPMCAGAIINARIPRLIFGACDPKAGACQSVCNLFELPFNARPQVFAGVLQQPCAALLTDFFARLRRDRTLRPAWSANKGSFKMITGKEKPRILVAGAMENPENYLRALEYSGFAPVHLRSCPNISDFDGLVIPGGADVDPSFYGQENVACFGVDKELDRYEMDLTGQFCAAKKPVLGICRGHQVIHVALGGSLIQHLPAYYEEKGICAPRQTVHSIKGADAVHITNAEDYMRRLYGETFAVNSAHHQAVLRPGENMLSVQWAQDGTMEASRHETLPVYTVQWHPERMMLAHAREDTVCGDGIFRFFYSHFD